MSARFVILFAAIAAALLGGGAAAFLLTNTTANRAPGVLPVNLESGCTPHVKTALEPAAVQKPITPEVSTPTKETAPGEEGASAKVLAGVEASLSDLVKIQFAVFVATQELADEARVVRKSKRRPSPKDEQPTIDRELLKGIVADQTDVLDLALNILESMKQAKLADLAADLEQVLRLLAAIVGNLTAREPDIGQLTLDMQEGVVGKLEKMRKGLAAARLPKVEVQEIPAPAEGQSGPMIVGTNKTATANGDRNATDLRIETGGKLTLGKGTLTVSGEFNNAGTLESSGTRLNMNGSNQTFSGTASFDRAHFSGGTKHFTAGSKLTTTYRENSNKDNPALVVEAGCTLIIDQNSEIHVPNAYGLRVAGTLIIEGGTVHCSYTHGHGVAGMNATWVKGSQLIIRSGKFICDGDSSFDGTSVYLQGGEIRVGDDIWGSGDLLDISGGVMSNDSGGGQFGFTGQVRMTGGRLEINQYEGRGFVVGKDCDFWCSGGEIVIGGQDVSDAASGIVLARSVQLPSLKVNVSTRISTNTPEGTTLSASGGISINKGKKLIAQGRNVIGNVETGENFGVFEP